MRRRIGFGLLLTCASGALACKKEAPPPSYPPSAPPPATAAPPAPAPVPGAAALGLPCTSDQDLQCVFAHCIANRCGGCSNASACKPGSQCFPTWLGYACLPAAPAAVPAPAPAPVPAPSSLDALRARCVQRTNEFRARVAASPLVRRPDREACGDAQAQGDGATGTAHGAFGRCQESAQNECPGWPGPIDQAIDQCLAQMFAEGPGTFAGHGHYLNMTEPSYRGVACGITTLANGQIWIVQDFYR
jgi:hypothetical protein